MRRFAGAVALLVVALPGSAWADPISVDSVEQGDVPKAQQVSPEFWSYFSAGLLMNYWGKPPIESAEIRDGRVRVVKSSQFSAGLALQAAYFFNFKDTYRSTDFLPVGDPGKRWFKHSELGIGPYIGVSLASKDIIDTISIGVALSARRKEGGVRFGFGISFDPDAQHLAADFHENAAAPLNATDVRYVTERAIGGQFMISFTPGFSE